MKSLDDARDRFYQEHLLAVRASVPEIESLDQHRYYVMMRISENYLMTGEKPEIMGRPTIVFVTPAFAEVMLLEPHKIYSVVSGPYKSHNEAYQYLVENGVAGDLA